MAVLSFQSSVAVGHVGHGAARFALERLGHEVWAIDTVILSNHPGYGRWRGRAADAARIGALVAGIREMGVFGRCRMVLSGYLGSAAAGRAVLDAVTALRGENPNALYCLDPVIGDAVEGRYVTEDLARLIANEALPMADILTPNAFELEYLSGVSVDGPEAAAAAARKIASPETTVIATSVPGGDGGLVTMAFRGGSAWAVTTPRIETPIKGAGDLLTALIVGRLLHREALDAALAGAVSAVYSLLESGAANGVGELPLIASQDLLVKPANAFSARPYSHANN